MFTCTTPIAFLSPWLMRFRLNFRTSCHLFSRALRRTPHESGSPLKLHPGMTTVKHLIATELNGSFITPSSSCSFFFSFFISTQEDSFLSLPFLLFAESRYVIPRIANEASPLFSLWTRISSFIHRFF